MNRLNRRILCIEDDYETCDLITYIFVQQGYEVVSCFDTGYLNLLQSKKFAAVILDDYFIGLSGVKICRQIREIDQRIPVVFFSGETRREKINEAYRAGGNYFLTKPADFELLVRAVSSLIEQ